MITKHTLMEEIYDGRKFRSFKNPRNFCIFAGINFRGRANPKILREFIFTVLGIEQIF